ncbi:MAG: vWA domain-containing protein, partial [Bryobacteraceae bacterium]
RRSGSRLVDSYLELRSSNEQTVSVEVIDPDGRRPLSLKDASFAQTYQLTQAGFYELKLANGRHDVIGVNADRRESNLDVIPDDALALWRGSPNADAAQTSVSGAVQQQTRPYSIWWYIMVLVLVAALAESLLADQYLSTRQEDS